MDLRSESRRNFAGLAWHGTFLAAASALGQPTTILPAYVALLGGSPLVVGAMLTVLLGGSVLPELFFAHVVEGAPRKRPFLLLAVYSRAASWIVLGAGSLALARSGGGALLVLLFLLLTAFALGGSLGSVAYTDMFGKSIAPGMRGRFYATRQFLGAMAALGVTYWASRLLSASSGGRIAYAELFLAAGVLMLVAGLGFVALREQPAKVSSRPPLVAYLREMPALWRGDRGLRTLVLVESVASLHLALLPFYMLLAVERLHVGAGAVAAFTMAQVIGGALSNALWGWLNDRFGSGSVLRLCLSMGALLPLLALFLSAMAPWAYGITFVLLGAAVNSRTLSFNNALVDLAPERMRATYTGLVGTLTAPALLLPLVGGSLVGALGYTAVFASVGLALAASAIYLWRSPALRARAAD